MKKLIAALLCMTMATTLFMGCAAKEEQVIERLPMPQLPTPTVELARDENGNISLGDFLKIKDEFVKEAFGEGVSLGANLA